MAFVAQRALIKPGMAFFGASLTVSPRGIVLMLEKRYLISRCPVGCAGELGETEMVLPEGPLRVCRMCGHLVSSCSREDYEASNQEWNTEEGTWPSQKDWKRMAYRKRRDLRTIRRLLGAKDTYRLLDVGCSNGAFVSFANSLGISAEGVDPSEKAVENGRRRGLKIHCGYLQELGFERHGFDAITMYEVIEHIDEPKALLRECHRILKPGGVLLVGTGNTDSWTASVMKERWDFFDMHRHGGHVSFFSTHSLAVLAYRTGYSLGKIRTSSVRFGDKNDLPWLVFRSTRILAELLNLPARLFRKGHQMEAFLIAKK